MTVSYSVRCDLCGQIVSGVSYDQAGADQSCKHWEMSHASRGALHSVQTEVEK